MNETPQSFESWAIVEVMGHKKYAGLVTEQVIGGQSFVRVDVPAIHDDNPDERREKFCKLFGSGSIYCITPVSEDVARAMVLQLAERPIPIFELRNLQNRQVPATLGFYDDAGDDHDFDPPDFG